MEELYEFVAVDDKNNIIENLNEYSGQSTISYTDGSKYFGKIVNGIREGEGEIVFKNGQIYRGCFSNNYYKGKGKYIFSNNSNY